MGAFFGFIFGLWFVGAVLSSPYFWLKRVDRSLAPVVRRFLALAYGFGWPYYLYRLFAPADAGANNSGAVPSRTGAPSGNPFQTSGSSSPEPSSSQPSPPQRAANPFRE